MFEMTNEDKDLHDIFHGEDQPMHPDTVHITLGGAGKPTAKAEAKKQATTGKETAGMQKPVNTQWEPVKPAPNYMDKLKATAKDMTLYAVLSVLLFWWQQSGRLEVTTSWWALLFCVGMMFFTIGRTWSVNK